MKFGLMYEIQIPEPHTPGIEHQRYHQVMAQAELVDDVGFDPVRAGPVKDERVERRLVMRGKTNRRRTLDS